MKKRVHILSSVNAANVSKADGTYTIKDVCGAVDDIVMNSTLYPAEQLSAGVSSLEGKPAPAGHPKNEAGQYISALNGEALASAWIGSYAKNARHIGGRTLVDVIVNEAQAKAHPDGQKLIERLDAAITGNNAEPIHVSTGLFHQPITANGKNKRGKEYVRIATNLQYDHLAILLNEQGAGTPADGVGMFLNSAGEAEEVEVVTVNTEPEDQRSKGLMAWIQRLVGNSSADMSFDQITSGLYALMPEGSWVRDVYDRYCIWTDRDGKFYKQDYSVSSDGSVAFVGQAVEVARKVEYEPINNCQEVDQVKDKIVAALNGAGIKTDGLTDDQILSAYNQLTVKPIEDKLVAANSQIATFEANAKAAKDAEVKALADELAVNSVLSADDLAKLGLDRLKELKANKGAAPILAASGATKGESEFKGYSINSINEQGAK